MKSGWVVYGPENGYNFSYTHLLKVKGCFGPCCHEDISELLHTLDHSTPTRISLSNCLELPCASCCLEPSRSTDHLEPPLPCDHSEPYPSVDCLLLSQSVNHLDSIAPPANRTEHHHYKDCSSSCFSYLRLHSNLHLLCHKECQDKVKRIH